MEVGKPFAEGKGEAGGSADIFEWNSEETKRIYGQTVESRFEDTKSSCLLSTNWSCCCNSSLELSFNFSMEEKYQQL